MLRAGTDTVGKLSARGTATRSAVRGSSLLLAGKVLALGVNFLSQVLIVRYLSKSDYGAFAYGISLVMLLKGIALFGLADTVARFLPMYRERGEGPAMAGTIAFATLTVLGVGLVLALGLMGVAALSGSTLIDSPRAVTLTMILAFLVPLEAFNDLLTTLFAVFASARSIFFRKWVLAPGMRLGLVVLLIAMNTGVVALAAGYLVVSAVGVAAYLWMFARVMRQTDWPGTDRRRFSWPVREIIGFAVPVMTTAVVWLLMESTDALLLGHFWSSEAVANFRAVLPVARLNQFVILTFGVLYTPLAAAAYTRRDERELSDLYWQTSAWICVLSFPIFLLTFAFARPIAVFLFGERYAGSGSVLAVVALGYFVQSATGFNGITLKVYRKMRYSVAIDVSAAAANLALSLLLVPRWGPIGAASSTCITMCLHNVLKQLGLWRFTGVSMLPRRQWPLYGAMAATGAGCVALQQYAQPGVAVAFVAAAAASTAVGLLALRTLRIESTFPELLRVPMVRAILRPFMGSA